MNRDFEVMLTYDFSDNPRHHKKPFDASYFDWMFDEVAEHGPATILYRANLAGRTYYPSKVFSPFDHSCCFRDEWHKLADVLDRMDPMRECVRAARERSLPVMIWVNWNEWQCFRQSAVHLVDPVWYANPTKYWASRDRSRFYHGMPVWGDEEVRARLLAMAMELIAYGSDGIYLSTRSHSWQPGYPVGDSRQYKEGDDFGFDDVVVEEYRRRHGLNIRYQDFDVEEWHRIKGEHFTELLRRTGKLCHDAGQRFIVGTPGDRYSATITNCHMARSCLYYKEWEKWVDQGIVDGIASEMCNSYESVVEIGDISEMKKALGKKGKLYPWSIPVYMDRNCIAPPFSLVKWRTKKPQEIVRQARMAKDAGAAGIVVHEFYWHLFIDTEGEDIGFGPLPQRELWKALK
ncbi:MAG: hypothetical protein V2A58_10405 [Planctomycetota bacterium]